MSNDAKQQAVVTAARNLVTALAMDRGARYTTHRVRELTLAVCALDDYPNPREGDQREWWLTIVADCLYSWRGLIRGWRGKTSRVIKGEDVS